MNEFAMLTNGQHGTVIMVVKIGRFEGAANQVAIGTNHHLHQPALAALKFLISKLDLRVEFQADFLDFEELVGVGFQKEDVTGLQPVSQQRVTQFLAMS